MTSLSVTALDPPDIREAPVYRIEFTVELAEGGTQDGLVHRCYKEFQKFDRLVTEWVSAVPKNLLDKINLIETEIIGPLFSKGSSVAPRVYRGLRPFPERKKLS